MSNLGILPLVLVIERQHKLGALQQEVRRTWKQLSQGQDQPCEVVISLLSMALLYALLVLAQTHTLFGSDRAGESERTGAAALLFSGNVALLVLCAYWRTDPEVFSS